MFCLYAQVHYGAAVSLAFVKKTFKVGNVEPKDYQGVQGFFGILGTYKGWLMGGQIFANKPLFSVIRITPTWSWGAKGLFGYNFNDTFLLYGGIGFENDSIQEKTLQPSKRLLFSADADLFVASGIGFGLNLSSRHPFSSSDFFKSNDVRILVKIIFRYL